MEKPPQIYAGFWARFAATVIDGILLVGLFHLCRYGWEYGRIEFGLDKRLGLSDEGMELAFLGSWMLASIALIIGCWWIKQTTPGKSRIPAKIVDAMTGEPPSFGQCLGRFFAYLVSWTPLGLGVLWIMIDRRKQGWHDKLAGTVVIIPKPAIGQLTTERKEPAIAPAPSLSSRVRHAAKEETKTVKSESDTAVLSPKSAPTPPCSTSAPSGLAHLVEVVVGRADDAAVRLVEKTVAPQHCVLIVDSGKLFIKDKSGGGTKVYQNGQWRTVDVSPVKITADTRIMLGEFGTVARELMARAPEIFAILDSGAKPKPPVRFREIRRNPETGEIIKR
jgi:uncharacterized RDD family membrane protein YckC